MGPRGGTATGARAPARLSRTRGPPERL